LSRDHHDRGNRYLREVFVPDHNARFAVPAAEEGSGFIPHAGRPLEDVLCARESRQIGRDTCVIWKGVSLQIPLQRHRHHSVKASVRVHEHPDGRLAIFDGPGCLARFHPNGNPIDVPRPLNSARRPEGPMDIWTTLRVAHNPTGPTTTAADI
jgi:hypothetical protein